MNTWTNEALTHHKSQRIGFDVQCCSHQWAPSLLKNDGLPALINTTTLILIRLAPRSLIAIARLLTNRERGAEWV